MIKRDFIIIGGGIIGINIARYLKKTYTDASILILEKESHCGMHASGRNSGVIHAGFYYSPDSLKAKFTRLGNKLLTEYCEEKKIPINKCGKLVVTKDEDELKTLYELYNRGIANQVPLEVLTEQQVKEVEPRARTFAKALFSATTSSVNPKDVMAAMYHDAIAEGIEIHCNVQYLRSKANNILQTSKGSYQAGYVVNCAGLYADHIARDFGFSQDYHILPFKGLYLYSNEAPFSFRTNIYPVPDLKNPFLGVHFTVTVDGKAKIGPTAIPALWREQYDFKNSFRLSEFADILIRQMGLLFFSEFDFKRLAVAEIKKYSRQHLVKLASGIANNIDVKNYQTFGTPGIRAQLLNVKARKLEMDFIIQGDDSSMHVLNAVSPAFTSSLPFCEYVCVLIHESLQKTTQNVLKKDQLGYSLNT